MVLCKARRGSLVDRADGNFFRFSGVFLFIFGLAIYIYIYLWLPSPLKKQDECQKPGFQSRSVENRVLESKTGFLINIPLLSSHFGFFAARAGRGDE